MLVIVGCAGSVVSSDVCMAQHVGWSASPPKTLFFSTLTSVTLERLGGLESEKSIVHLGSMCTLPWVSY